MKPRKEKIPRRVRAKKVKVTSTNGRRVASINALTAPGDFCVMPRSEALGVFEIACIFPGQTTKSGFIVRRVEGVVRTPQCADHVWNWDGDEDRPTTNPEIDMRATKAGERDFVGYLLDGKFVSV